MSFAATSYLKTTAVAACCAAAGIVAVIFGLHSSLPAVQIVLAGSGLVVALAFGVVCAAGAVVVIRSGRDERGAPDLFLTCNRSREVAALKVTNPPGASRFRRWLSRRLLGHDLIVGDIVEVKSWPEIRATLDAHGCLEALPFMPEMLPMCGRRAVVYRAMHRLFDHRKTRRMRHMRGTVLLADSTCDGSSHFGCDAACYVVWKAAWLRRIDREGAGAGSQAPQESVSRNDDQLSALGTQGPRYVCQLTQLNEASHPLADGSLANFIRPLVARNVTPTAFAVAWLTNLFNIVQHHRGGVSYPAFPAVTRDDTRVETPAPLRAGDRVVVRSAAEIRATLNDQMYHRGLWFEVDMLKHCGRQCEVEGEARRLIDIVTGEMLTMKTPAYILKDVRFSGERHVFNTQCDAFLWRAAWLRREGG